GRGGEVLRQLDRARCDFGGDDSGMEDRSRDVEFAPIDRERTGQAVEAPLAGRVSRAVLTRHSRRNGSDVDDSAAALFLHDAEGGTAAQESRGQVGFDDLVPEIE